MYFDEGTEYKASNGQVFIIKGLAGFHWSIDETASSYLSRDQSCGEYYYITAASYSECVAWIEEKIKKEIENRKKERRAQEERKAQEEREKVQEEREKERIAQEVETYFNLIKDRVAELKKAFEASGRKQNFADPSEIDSLKLDIDGEENNAAVQTSQVQWLQTRLDMPKVLVRIATCSFFTPQVTAFASLHQFF